MAKEIERKFLVNGEGWRQVQGVVYRQGYLSTDKHCTVRVRTIGTKGYITVKGQASGAARLEFEYEIPLEDTQLLMAELCQKPLIHKTRYKIPYEGLTWEVDEFAEENEGLILAEVELPDADHPFTKPGWVGVEVTDDPRYFNANLVQYPYSQWQKIEKELATRKKTAYTEILNALQKETYQYFIQEVNPDNGLTADKSGDHYPASIAATGFALTTYPVVVEDGLLSRQEAAQRTLNTLRFFWNSPQSQSSPCQRLQRFLLPLFRYGKRATAWSLRTINSGHDPAHSRCIVCCPIF